MNKEKYHFQIPKEEKDNFQSVVKSLTGKDPVSHAHVCYGKTGVMIYDYNIELSKYELLYLSLSINSGKYQKISQELQSEI